MAGRIRDISTEMIEITTSNSINVKPFLRKRWLARRMGCLAEECGVDLLNGNRVLVSTTKADFLHYQKTVLLERLGRSSGIRATGLGGQKSFPELKTASSLRDLLVQQSLWNQVVRRRNFTQNTHAEDNSMHFPRWTKPRKRRAGTPVPAEVLEQRVMLTSHFAECRAEVSYVSPTAR